MTSTIIYGALWIFLAIMAAGGAIMAVVATMQIWLGKNMLGQTDKAEVKTHQTFSFVVDLS